MNSLQRTLAKLILGEAATKSLYDLHPELRDREPIMRVWSDAEAQLGSGYQAAIGDYTGNVWVHKAVKIIADNIAPLRVRVIRGDEDQEVSHPVADLLNYVNPTMSTSALWQQWVLDMLLGGECGFELVRNNGRRYAEIWPHAPTQFNVRVNKTARYGNVTGYRIDDGQGEPFDLPPDEFIHFKFYNPANPWRGLAPITAVRMGILIDEYAQAWARMFFKNGSRPDYAVVAPQGLTPREREEIIAKLEMRNGGLSNAHRPIVLEAGVTDIKTFSFPPKDIEWLKQREMSREEIGALFGVPDEMMGWGRDTYENFGMALKVLWQLTLVPLIGKRDGQLSEFFRSVGDLRPDERVDTDLSGVQALQDDRAQLIDQAVKLFGIGVPLQEINTLIGLGLGEIAGTDVGYLSSAMIPVTRVGAGPAPERSMPLTPATIPPGEPEQKAISAESPQVPYGGELHRAMYMLFSAREEPVEAEMRRLLRRAFQEQQDRVTRAARRAPDLAALAVGQLLDEKEEKAIWQRTFEAAILAAILAGGRHGFEQGEAAGGEFDSRDEAITAAASEFAATFVALTLQTTTNDLMLLLMKAQKEGWAALQFYDAIAALYEEYKTTRADMIALNEILRAFNYGLFLAYQQLNDTYKGWMSVLDWRTRTPMKGDEFDHVSAHGEEVPLLKPFMRTGEPMMYPKDPHGSAANVINCRCTMYRVRRR